MTRKHKKHTAISIKTSKFMTSLETALSQELSLTLSRVFHQRGAFKSFAKLKGKSVRRSLFSIKLQARNM